MGHQQRQDLKLPRGERDLLPRCRHPDGLPVQDQVRVGQQPLSASRRSGELLIAPELRLYPSQYLGIVERLGNEVVRPQPQHVDPVLQPRLGGEDQDRHRLFLPHLGDELLPGKAGEHQVQQHQIIIILLRPQYGLAAGESGAYVVAPVGEDTAQQAVDVLVVLHH